MKKWLSAVLMMLFSGAIWAQHIYVCKDPTGRTLTSDRPIPECTQSMVRELRKDGSTLRVIEPPLSDEERKARMEAEEQRKIEIQAQQEQRRRDKALLSMYANEAQLEQARHRQIALIESDIQLSEQRIRTAERNLQELHAEAKASQEKRQPFVALKQRTLQQEAIIKTEQDVIESKRTEISKLNQKFDQELARYRELTKYK